MSVLSSSRIRLLIGANVIAIAAIFATGASAQWGTWCPPSATGCDCLSDVPFNPDGCYDNLGDEFLCSSNQFCNEQH